MTRRGWLARVNVEQSSATGRGAGCSASLNKVRKNSTFLANRPRCSAWSLRAVSVPIRARSAHRRRSGRYAPRPRAAGEGPRCGPADHADSAGASRPDALAGGGQIAENDSTMQTERALIPLRDLPSPRSFPVLGNLLQTRFDRLHLTLENWAERYRSMYAIRIGPHRIAVISDRSAIQHVLIHRPGWFRCSHCEANARLVPIGHAYRACCFSSS